MNKRLFIDLLPVKNNMHVGRLIILLPISIAALLFAFFFRSSAQDEADGADSRDDMLAYVSADDHLMLYNPRDRSEITVLDNVRDFALGRNGRIAFTKADEQDSDLYVFDPSTPTLEAINISDGLVENNAPLGWSPNERYLAFESYDEGDGLSLYVWDGETSINVMPDNGLGKAVRVYVNWSYDGRLAFTLDHGWSEGDVPPENYLWDGSATTNLNPNPEGYDGIDGWSQTGQLLLLANRNGDSGTYVWDGVSFKDGVADSDSFIRVAPELNLTFETWTEDGFVGFTIYANPPFSGTKEIVIWDLENQVVVEQFPIASENVFSWLAEGGEVVLSTQLASGLPSDYLDIENTEGEILFSVHTGQYAWSADGYLAYCGIGEGREWLLSLWDGEESWVVTPLENKPVRWQHGDYSFNCNNG